MTWSTTCCILVRVDIEIVEWNVMHATTKMTGEIPAHIMPSSCVRQCLRRCVRLNPLRCCFCWISLWSCDAIHLYRAHTTELATNTLPYRLRLFFCFHSMFPHAIVLLCCPTTTRTHTSHIVSVSYSHKHTRTSSNWRESTEFSHGGIHINFSVHVCLCACVNNTITMWARVWMPLYGKIVYTTTIARCYFKWIDVCIGDCLCVCLKFQKMVQYVWAAFDSFASVLITHST